MLLSLNGAKFRIPYYKQFLGRRCGICKSCWLDDDYMWRDVRVVCALRT
jgi:phage-related protein